MRIIFNSLFFLLIGVNTVKGQTVITATKHGKSIIDVSVYNGATFNSMNLRNDNIYPNSLSVPSSTYLSQKVAVDFQRTTKTGFVYGGGLEFGSTKQNYNLEYKSLDFIDTNAMNLKPISKKIEYRYNSPYIGLRIFIGYSLPVHPFHLKSTTLEGKILVGKKVYFKGAYYFNNMDVVYEKNDTINVMTRAIQLNGFYGNGGGSLSGTTYSEINIGFRKQISQSFFNSFYVGLYGSVNLSDANNVDVQNIHYNDRDHPTFDHDYFKNKDYTLGLKIGFGLKI